MSLVHFTDIHPRSIFTIPVAVALILLILACLNFLVLHPWPDKSPQTSSRVVYVTTAPTSSPSPPPTPYLLKPIVSPRHDYYVQTIMTPQPGDNYKLKMSVRGTEINSQETIIVSDLLVSKQLGNLFFNYSGNFASWSTDDQHLAILTPTEIQLYTYQKQINPSVSPPVWDLKLSLVQSLPVNLHENSAIEPVQVIFSGNGRQLFYEDLTGIKIIYPQAKAFTPQTGYVNQTLYPIPNSNGLAYWLPDTSNPHDYNNYRLVLDYGSNFQIYKITFASGVDGTDKILLSPGLDKACVSWNSSGSYGTMLFNLATGQRIPGGDGCLNWLNNSQVVVTTHEYDAPAKDFNSYYLFDTNSQQQTFLFTQPT